MAVAQESELDVRQAAALVGRHPETVRRWIWSGKLASKRRGSRLMVEREALLQASGDASAKMTLEEWFDSLREMKRESGAVVEEGSSAADLVIEDRRTRR